MKTEEYKQLDTQFRELFETYQLKLSPKASSEIKHYVNHTELEMAFEGFCLELIQESIELKFEERELILDIGKKLQLDQQTVFDIDFWENLKNYLDKLKS